MRRSLALLLLPGVLLAAVPEGDTASATTPPWKTVLYEPFNTPGRPPAEFTVYSGVLNGGTRMLPSHTWVDGKGRLVLLYRFEKEGPDGPAWYGAGLKVAPEYGGVHQAVTVRYRVDRTGVAAGHRNVPMRYVNDPRYATYQGEADYGEGSLLDETNAHLHYGPNHTQISRTFRVNMTRWHVWRAEQVRHTVRIWCDGKLLWAYRGNRTTVPNAFRRTVFQEEKRFPYEGGQPRGTHGREKLLIDWVRIRNYVG